MALWREEGRKKKRNKKGKKRTALAKSGIQFHGTQATQVTMCVARESAFSGLCFVFFPLTRVMLRGRCTAWGVGREGVGGRHEREFCGG